MQIDNCLGPHLTSSVKRFGDYTLNMAKPPEPWLDDQMIIRCLEKGRPGCRAKQFCLSSEKRRTTGIETLRVESWNFTLISGCGPFWDDSVLRGDRNNRFGARFSVERRAAILRALCASCRQCLPRLITLSANTPKPTQPFIPSIPE